MGEEGTPVDFRTFLLPRSDYEIEDVWDTIGLRGTGSNDIIVKDAFVPEYRTLSFMDTGRCFGPGQAVNTGAAVQAAVRVGVLVLDRSPGARHGAGRVRGVRRAGRRSACAPRPAARRPTTRSTRCASPMPRHASTAPCCRSSATSRRSYDYAVKGEKIPMPLRVRVRRDQVNATGAGIAAVDRLFESAGGRALRTGTPIQRFWRDAHAGRVHAINDPEKALVMYGQFELGLKVQDAWL